MADLVDLESAQSVKIVLANPSGSEQSFLDKGQQAMTASLPVTISSDQSPVDAGVILGDQYVPTTPDTGTTQTRLLVDPDGQLKVRGDVLTDEGTFRDDFSGNSLPSSRWTSTTAGGASASVLNSLVTLASGTNANGKVSILAIGDYGPISLRSFFSISQRINNQTIDFGFKDSVNNTMHSAYFQFTGTVNTTLNCISQSSDDASDIQTTAITLPASVTTAQNNEYYIEVLSDQVSFFINGAQVASHKLHIPGPYDAINIIFSITNSAVVTNTNLIADYAYFVNQNSLQVQNSHEGDPLQTRVRTGLFPTYGASIANLTFAANATDVFTISGSATKTIKIKQIKFSATQTTATVRSISLIKRSTANTGGTSTARTNVRFDSNSAAATATVLAYTANPTLGTAVGTIWSEKILIPTTTGLPDKLNLYELSDVNMQNIILRGTSEILAVNMEGVSSAGNSTNIFILWTEE